MKLTREPGVTSQYESHVHVYPSRYHGGIWTRPVWGPDGSGPPYVVAPSTILKPDDWAEGIPGSAVVGEPGIEAGVHGYYSRYPWPDYRKPMRHMNYGSMGALGANPSRWKVGDGVFRNGITAGGGVFNTAIAGLGSLGGAFGYEGAVGAAPRRRRRRRRRRRGYAGFGAEALGWTSKACWSPPGGSNPDDRNFRACHDKQLSRAQEDCYDFQRRGALASMGFTSFDDCVRSQRDRYIDQNCLQYCAKPSAGAGAKPPPSAPPVTPFVPREEGMSGTMKALLLGGAAAAVGLWFLTRKKRPG